MYVSCFIQRAWLWHMHNRIMYVHDVFEASRVGKLYYSLQSFTHGSPILIVYIALMSSRFLWSVFDRLLFYCWVGSHMQEVSICSFEIRALTREEYRTHAWFYKYAWHFNTLNSKVYWFFFYQSGFLCIRFRLITDLHATTQCSADNIIFFGQ